MTKFILEMGGLKSREIETVLGFRVPESPFYNFIRVFFY